MAPADKPELSKHGGVAWYWRALVIAAIVALLALVGWGLARAQEGRKGSGPAPDFVLETFGGETIRLSDLRGQVVVINFWASWCPPCREEAPYLEATWREFKDQGVVFLGVDYVDTDAEALAYIEEFGITYPNGPDLQTKISQAYRIQGVPETFFIGKDGAIRSVKVGPLSSPELEDRILPLIEESYP